MSEIEKISLIFKNKKIKEKYWLEKVRIFGSYARWLNTKESDIDFLVDYKKPLDIILYFSLKKELENLFWKKVDIINNKFLKNKFRDYIKDDLIII